MPSDPAWKRDRDLAERSRYLSQAVPSLRLALRRPSALVLAWEWWWGLPFAAIVGLGTALYYVVAPDNTRPLFDDSFISLTFARNLAEHYKLSFDGVDWSTGATSPLHVFVLAVLLKLGVEPIFASLAVGVAGSALLAASVYLLAWSIFRSRLAAVLGAFAISFAPYVALDAGNGLETTLFMSLVALSFGSYLLWQGERGRALTGAIMALAVLTRPEGAFLIPAVVIYRWLDRPNGERLPQYAREAVLLAAPGIAVLGLMTLYSLALNGTLTGTASAKLRFFQEDLVPFREKINITADGLGLFIAPAITLAALALPAVRRKEVLLFALFWVPVVVAYCLLFPGGLRHYFYRYQHPVLPLLAALAAGGAAQLIQLALTREAVVKLLVAAALVVAVVPIWQEYERWRDVYAQASAETLNDLEAMAKDLNQIIQPNEVLATHDIGAVGFYGDFSVLDLVGLVNKKVIDYHDGRRVAGYVEGSNPDYLLIFPSWDLYFLLIFPDSHPDRFQLVKVYPGGPIRGEPYLLYRVLDR